MYNQASVSEETLQIDWQRRQKKERQKDTKDTITEVYGNWERGEGIYKEKKKIRM